MYRQKWFLKDVSDKKQSDWMDNLKRQMNEPKGAWVKFALSCIYKMLLNQICPFSTINTTRSVSLSSPCGSYSFFKLAPKRAANV